MTPEAQRIAIAESLGWTRSYDDLPNCWRHPVGALTRTAPDHLIPDYLNDLNACAEFERELKPITMRWYADTLCDMVSSGDPDPDIHAIITATAAQRCEAYLRAIGKWGEGK